MDYIQAANYCLDFIQKCLKIFVEKILINKYSQDYQYYLCNGSNNNSSYNKKMNDTSQSLPTYQDALFYLNAFQKNWNVISDHFNSKESLNLSYSLRSYRNQIAHQAPITLRQFYRFVDETEFFLEELGVNKAELDQIEIIRKNLVIQMAQCNDSIIVMSKKAYNTFDDINAEMKSEDGNNSSYNNNNANKKNAIEDQIIEAHYEKILSNCDGNNYMAYSYLNNDDN